MKRWMELLTLQGDIPDFICPIAKDKIPPKMPATLFPENQIACRVTCSDGLYHIDVRRLKPGDIMLSNMPRKNRRVNSDWKLDAAPWQARITAQMPL